MKTTPVPLLAVPLLALGTSAFSPSAAQAPPVPQNFTVKPSSDPDSVTLSWSSSAPQIRFHVQKRLPTGQWTSISGFPVNHVNTGTFCLDTPTTKTGTLRFAIQAVEGSASSDKTMPWIVKEHMH